jgi:hypothetical protein
MTDNFSFVPETDFSRNMLETIPRKVKFWLESLNQPMNSTYGLLTWDFEGEIDTIVLDADDCFFQIWVGEEGVSASDERVERIENNLDFFAKLEKRIYDELTRLQLEMLEKQKLRNLAELPPAAH